MIYRGTIVDIHGRRLFEGELVVEAERIARITRIHDGDGGPPYLLPGFVDAHVHIESSMLPPDEFSRWAAIHGTIATVSDPHEIANVLGRQGVEWMLTRAQMAAFPIVLGAPSCVPATVFETAGSRLDAPDVAALLALERIGYLSEVMNYPGVLAADPDLMAKIAAAHAVGKPVDGHAPGVRGEQARAYAAAGISTDHECFTLEEALDKIAAGMFILIREGSAARNFSALHPLLAQYPDRVMFCTDDLHPDALMSGHINRIVARAVQAGYDLFDVLRAASLTPAQHYNIPIGLLRHGDRADFIVVESLETMEVTETFIAGRCIVRNGAPQVHRIPPDSPNRWAALPVSADTFRIPAQSQRIRVIGARDGQLVTDHLIVEAPIQDGHYHPDPENDVLLIAIINRYAPTPPAVGFVKGFGLQRGAIASSVAHDSHNIVAIGATPEALAAAINTVIEYCGGISVCDGTHCWVLPLPIAGLMSIDDGPRVAERYADLDRRTKELGSQLRAPLMALSFMALLVIPSLKLSDRGLFDGERFELVPLEVPD
ncbi:MAG: adenine deaminase [Chlorobi bacterium]|nr:adenine deaminase [Chlorobiota bacterium]